MVDSTSLSRSLFFTTQLLELGIPTVVALNKIDANSRKGNRINVSRLSELLGCPVVETSSSANIGLDKLIRTAISLRGSTQTAPFSGSVADKEGRRMAKSEDRRRFEFVKGIVAAVESRNTRADDLTLHDKIDAVITHPLVGIPIFAAVMFLVFQISQSWLGVWLAEGYVFREGEANELVAV